MPQRLARQQGHRLPQLLARQKGHRLVSVREHLQALRHVIKEHIFKPFSAQFGTMPLGQ
jgi:hypothetical protein